MRAPVASAMVGSRSTSIWKSMISRLSASAPSARRSSSPIEMSIAFSSAPYPPAVLGAGASGRSARKAGPDAMPGDALFAVSLSGAAMFLFLIEVALDEFLQRADRLFGENAVCADPEDRSFSDFRAHDLDDALAVQPDVAAVDGDLDRTGEGLGKPREGNGG